VHRQAVVEASRLQVAHVRFEHERFDPLGAQLGVAAGVLLEIGDARDLEPHEVVRVVGNSLRVRLGEAHAHVRREPVAVHAGESRRGAGCDTRAVNEAERLAGLLVQNQPCVVLTGAGISTESGVPDFRSAGGIWAQYDAMEVASIDAFRRDPTRVWEFYGRRLGLLDDVQPNDGHRALAELEQRGLVRAVVTQNVDGLHAEAGTADLLEVHGSLRSASCPRCGRVEPVARVRELLPVPRCADDDAVLKPDVVMFGELLDAATIDRATTLAREAALLLVVGSSLAVWPVAGLPGETLAAGGRLAVVNLDPTPWDEEAALVVRGGAGPTLAAVEALVA
jgi:NAD-dependent deacetylase